MIPFDHYSKPVKSKAFIYCHYPDHSPDDKTGTHSNDKS